jgi:hypothetical protein
MFIAKHKKLAICLVAVAVMSLGGVTALAASTPNLQNAPVATHFDPSKAEIKPGTCTVAGSVKADIEGNKTTAPAPSASLADAAGSVYVADASSILGDNFTIETINADDLHPLPTGQNNTTAAKGDKTKSTSEVSLADDTGSVYVADASSLLGDNFTVKTINANDLHPLTPGQNYTTASK